MLRYDFEESVCYWTCMASHAIRRALSTRLADAGITFRQWEVLAWLARNEDISQAELADCMGIEPHTLAGVVRRMERDGWLDRTCCSEDRRKNKLKTTAKAEEIWEAALEHCDAVRDQAIRNFTPAEVTLLKKLCGEIKANLEVEEESDRPAIGLVRESHDKAILTA